MLDGPRRFRCHPGGIILLSSRVFSLDCSGPITKALTTVIPADPLAGLGGSRKVTGAAQRTSKVYLYISKCGEQTDLHKAGLWHFTSTSAQLL